MVYHILLILLAYKPAVTVGQFLIAARQAVLVTDHVLGYFPKTPYRVLDLLLDLIGIEDTADEHLAIVGRETVVRRERSVCVVVCC